MTRLSLLSTLLFATTTFGADLLITGPYTHDNLSVYLLHASGTNDGAKLLTLQEAMAQQKVAVYETGQVNELAIENKSAEDVYIQAGDIVKGGRQDRVLSTDLVLPPHSGRLPIGAFCVEHGRWTQRGSEASDRFSASNRAVSFKEIKMAVRDQGQQSKVWQEVASAQRKLAVSGALSAAAPSLSPSSMQLTLENSRLAETTAGYVDSLAKIIDSHADAVGFVYAINGRINSADQYASRDLFRRMWMKMLQAAATEAVAARDSGKSTPPDIATVRATLSAAETAPVASRETAMQTVVLKRETEKTLLFEARSANAAGAWIHKSWVVK
jgi:hypothetical protein